MRSAFLALISMILAAPVWAQSLVISAGAMSPAAVHCSAVPAGGNRYFSPAAIRPGVPLSKGDALSSLYEWEFLSADGKPDGQFARLRGFNASHIFEHNKSAAQTYIIRLTITQYDGSKIRREQAISVAPDGRKYIFVDAQAGNDAAAGDAAGPMRSIEAAMKKAGAPNMGLMLARTLDGSAYGITKPIEIKQRQARIAGYIPPGRERAMSRPAIRWDAPNSGASHISISADDFALDGVDFDCKKREFNGSNFVPTAMRGGNIRNVSIRNSEAICAGGFWISPLSPADGFLMQGCSASNRAIGGNIAYIVGANFCFIDNRFINYGVHGIRVAGVDGLNIYRNTIRRDNQPEAPGPRTTIVDHVGSYHWMRGNHLTNSLCTTGPLDVGDDAGDRVRWVVIEQNTNRGEATASGLDRGQYGTFRIGNGSENVILRNNFVSGRDQIQFEAAGFNENFNRGTMNVIIVNNSGVNSGSGGKFFKRGGSSGVALRNNLYVCPASAAPYNLAAEINGSMTGFAAPDGRPPVDRNVWPPSRAEGRSRSTKLFKFDSSTRDLPAWNRAAPVGDDKCAAALIDPLTFRPAGSNPAAGYSRADRFVWDDINGVSRKRSGWIAAGCAE